jgi:long-chain-fatty-acid--CoA ligase ACSBG
VNHSESLVVFCEDNRHLAKFLAIKSELPTVKAYVVWNEEPNVKGDDIMSWAQFLKLGEGTEHQATLDARIAGLKPSRCCTLIYTSGTTGNPKACMISHDNMVWTATTVGKVISAGPADRTISYLPLSHIAAQMLDIVLPIVHASELHFAQPDALRGSLPQTLQDVRPTLFLGVPRVWEKVEAKLRDTVRTATGLKKSLLDWALEIGRDSHRSMQLGGDSRWGFSAANFLVWSKVRAQLGFDQLRGAYSAAAPISKETLEFFNGLNIPVYEIYGMSESSGPQTVSYEGHVRTGTVGPTFPGAETRIDRPDANGDGEICMRGRHIMMGYLNNPQATAETIDKDGWLHSGDVGRVDATGFLAITGRIKELIITAGGENIPPVMMENELKNIMGNVISNVMIIGDRMKFLSAVFTLQTKPNLQAQPGQYPFFDDLTDVCVATLSALGSTSTTLTAALKDDIVKKFIQDGINKYNNVATSRAQQLRKFFIAPAEFSVEGDELTATMKLKRRVVLQKYSKEIEGMYEGDAE